MGNALASELQPGSALEESSEDGSGPEDTLVQRIRNLLDRQQIGAAKEAAAHGARLFPGHSWLVKADKVLNSRNAKSRPARDLGVDRRKEYEWLRENQAQYKDRWVALLEGNLIASADSFEDLMQDVGSRNLKARPLVHHIA